jgi:hypothetical protein
VDKCCRQCQRAFRRDELAASISGSILGDEYTDSYFLCTACQLYTVVSWYDNFTGTETMRTSGPISRADGDASVALIRRCGTPWEKKCRCEAHLVYFRNTLD